MVVGGRITIILGLFLVAACAEVELSPPPRPLSPPTFEAIGILADERVSDLDRTFILTDGRRFDISMLQTRLLFDDGGGIGAPFVLGSDGTGPFVGIFGRQDGLPDGCNIAGIGAEGIDRGPFIEIKGVMWRKAPTFDPASAPPSSGTPYQSSTRFCFDDHAQVTSTVP